MRWNVTRPSLTAATMPARPGSVSTIPAADLATSVAVETAIPICAWRSAGASFAPSPHIPTICPSFCSALTRLNLSSGSTLAKIEYASALRSLGSGVVCETGPVIPTSPATTCAVVPESPVTMTVRTPRLDNSETSTAESSRGGSLSAMKPMSASLSDDPAATARTLNPFNSNPATIGDALAEGWDRTEMTANAPLTIFIVVPSTWSAVASERFSEGSNGTNVTSLG